MPVSVRDLPSLLEQSCATGEFKQSVLLLEAGARPACIRIGAGQPPVKVLRVLAKLLEEEPAFDIREVVLDAVSTCSSFVGSISVNGGELKYDFAWDCSWRARQEGWFDFWGAPDQIRAAGEFGYQCFERFERVI